MKIRYDQSKFTQGKRPCPLLQVLFPLSRITLYAEAKPNGVKIALKKPAIQDAIDSGAYVWADPSTYRDSSCVVRFASGIEDYQPIVTQSNLASTMPVELLTGAMVKAARWAQEQDADFGSFDHIKELHAQRVNK